MRSARLLALLAAPLTLIGGCTTVESIGSQMASTVGLTDAAPRSYTSSSVSQARRTGIAVADEPYAARAGAVALADSGNAVDAVTTMFFTLSATYPVAAGLGAGGICLVRDTNGRVTEFDFLTRQPRAGGAYAIPGAVRGFHEMQTLYGALPWQRTVGPGEAYAATGFAISQALATRLAESQNVVRLDASLAAEFLDESGQPRAVGTEARNVPLSQAMTQIRLNGADGFYKGATAQRIVAWSAAQGGAITADELAATAAKQTAPRQRRTGGLTAWLPGPGTGAGAFSGALLDNLARSGGNAASVATAARQTLAAFGVASLPRDLGSTGFAAVDASGQAASCAITLNGPFGSGRTAEGTGVQLAASPAGAAGLASAFLAPVLAMDEQGVALAGAGAGGPNGAAAMAHALLQASQGRQLGRRGDLRGTGNAPYDTVNVISCDREACIALTDPGAHGMGTVAEAVAQSAIKP